jgi:glycosyltransferase involved in cell wall biosynthesis
MRVAIDTNCILPGRVGGIENYALALVEALRLPGSPAAELVLLTRPENHDLFGRFVGARTVVVKLDRPLHLGRPIDNWATLLADHPDTGRRALAGFQRHKAELLRRLGVDLVHFPGNTVNPLDLNLPVVLNLHDLQHRHFPQYFATAEIDNRERWWRASADRADALVAASQYVRDDLRDQWNVDPARVFVTPDPLEAAFAAAAATPPAADRLAELRGRLALPATFFVYPAAAWPHKNHDRLVRAFAAAATASPATAGLPANPCLPAHPCLPADAELVLTGGGHEASPLPALAASLGVAGRVRVLGRVTTDDLIGLYHLATALVFPSKHESWSIPVMEAMACGCPVASSDVTSLPEEVADAGLLFPPNDQAAMAVAMRLLAADAPLRATLAARGRERVKAFTPRAFLKVLSAAYEHARQTHRAKRAA